MSRTRLLTAALLLGLAPLATAQKAEAPAKKLYCWNEGGRKVCGDALPATAVDSARTEINPRSGLPTARVDRALTPEERAAAEAAARAEQEEQAAAEAEMRRVMAMVHSFDSEDALRRAFDNRIALNRDSVKTAQMGIAGIRVILVDLLRRAGEAELAQRPVPKKLADDIRTQHAQLRQQQAALARLQRSGEAIRAQLEEAVARYRELRMPGAAPVLPAG
ncbi:MAG: hypothetical protein ACOY37_02860 [Pseudomonadota bacterium]|uniref:hypothetical protein n=1 Tax=Lysobacter sp. N42 TaxID=2545719 RepID=UPI001043E6AB|nr:hypothetical protein [Lysobacter sp. N42]TCZ79629.1 hypothetical protein EYQ95_25175 [Lysobacter sp. N42]